MRLVPHGQPPVYFTFPSLAAVGVPHATTTRHFAGMRAWSEGSSPFAIEAVEVLRGARLDLQRVAWARQVHGADVAQVAAGGGFCGSADVIVTTERAVSLAIFTADCLAITVCDLGAGVLGVAHVGWRGTVAGAAQAAVTAATKLGARAGELSVAISPSIGPCCYEVDAPVVERLAAAYPASWERWVTPAGSGHWMLDLWSANDALLREAGVAAGRIENPRLCTACHPELLFSYRKGNRGRLATLVALP